jgi:protein-S-isoprenylcysteine O-methyltransferase Ste14
MSVNMLFIVSYLSLFTLSAYFYKNDPKYYTVGKEDKSEVTVEMYSVVNHYLRFSTLVVALLSVYSSNKLLALVHDNIMISCIGHILAWIGLYFFIRSKTDLGDNYSPCYDAYLPHSITRKGLYSRVRHPIYSSNIFTLFSIFIATGSLWILFNCLLLTYFYNKSAKVEEAELSSKYKDYGDYMNNTNRYLPSIAQLFK